MLPVDPVQDASSLVEVLTRHAREIPDKPALLFPEDGDPTAGAVSFAELDRRVRAFAAALQAEHLAGERVLLLLPQGPEYVVAFLGALYAGAVAVPAFPLTGSRRSERIHGILQDCAPGLVVTTARQAEAWDGGQGSCAVRAFEDIVTDRSAPWTPPTADPSALAYLQYTSGSTSAPRGVMVTHGNLVQQLRLMGAGLGRTSDDVFVSWLPFFHDFGLVGGLLYPLWLGATDAVLAPAAFVQRPLRWLSAVSALRATTTWAPNFALELCCSRIDDEQRRGLDLSGLTVLGSGAEPIRPETLESFASSFGPCGLDPQVFVPGYGMAETVLTVSIRDLAAPLVVTAFRTDDLESGRLVPAPGTGPRSRRLVSNGVPSLDTELVVVDPETRRRCPDGREGELWVSGRTVAPGYWGQPEVSAVTFGAALADGTGHWLRTGDLGARYDGQVYVTGRRKDLMILCGRNVHPQDVERTVGRSSPALAGDRAAAFGVQLDGEEALVVVCELSRTRPDDTDPADVVSAVRLAIAEEHDLAAAAVVVLRPASLPVTSSGKVQRQECRRRYLQGELSVLHVSEARCHPPVVEIPAPDTATPVAGASRAALVSWLVERVAALATLPVEAVDPSAPFGSFGLDSRRLVGLSGEIEQRLGRTVSPTLLYDHPSIDRLSGALTGPPAADRPAASQSGPSVEPVAVVGLACRLPGAESAEEFWDLLAAGREAVGPVPAGRWNEDEARRPDGSAVPGRLISSRGGFLPDVAGFDAAFFGISQAEAEGMDPQQRVLLTTVWRALEDAGIAADSLAGSATGVFVGISGSDYRQLQAQQLGGRDAYAGTGNALSIAANRISYLFDLRGPSLAVDTACSSSLVAVHQAVAALRDGSCELAIVAGVNLLLDPALSVVFSQAGMLAPDGACKTFDASADGYVRGEGCGVLVLKRQSAASRDRDRIRGLVRGTAVNQDGRSSTLTAPNGPAQQAVMRSALSAAGVSARDVTLVEAHGTGTRLGDPVEMGALSAVYGGGDTGSPLWVGSVKTGIGHLEAAAGIAGMIKVLLALEHRTVPAHLHLRALNPLIRLYGTRCRIPTETTPWSVGTGPRLAAVSSFGFGGTNAHVVLEEAPADPPTPAGPPSWEVLPVSARTPSALGRLVQAYVARLSAEPEQSASLARLAATAGERRQHHDHRLAVVARSSREAALLLRRAGSGAAGAQVAQGVRRGPPSTAAFLFPGQGSQYPGMAAALYDRSAVFRRAVIEADAVVADRLGRSLLPTLCGTAGPDLALDLDQTGYAQPALFVVDHAFARLWQSYGVEPAALLGHSLGEYVAACIGGVLTLEDALSLVCVRGQLMQDHAGAGAMVAVRGERGLLAGLVEDVEATDDVAVAAVNGPEELVVSGPPAGVAELVERYERRGARTVRLAGSRAFHAPAMRRAAEQLVAYARGLTFRPSRVPIVSNLTGRVLGPDEITADYWGRHALAPVQLATGLATLAGLGVGGYVECGPRPVLSGIGMRTLPDALWLPSLRRDDTDDRTVQQGLAQWYAHGGVVDWAGRGRALTGRTRPQPPVALPPYPLAERRYWFAAGEHRGRPGPALLGERLELAGRQEDRFTAVLSSRQPAYLGDHRVLDGPVLPAAATLETVLAAARTAAGATDPACTLRGLTLLELLRLPADGQPVTVQTVVEPADGGHRVRCFARSSGAGRWHEHAGAELVTQGVPAAVPIVPPDELRRGLAELDVDELYRQLSARGLDYGPAFRNVRQLFRGNDEAVGLVRVDEPVGDDVLGPRILDSCLHVAAALLGDADGLWLPAALDELVVHAALPPQVWCRVRSRGRQGGEQLLDLVLLSAAGERLAALQGLRLRRLPSGSGSLLAGYRVSWRPLPAPPVPVLRLAERTRWLVVSSDPATALDWQADLTALGSPATALSTAAPPAGPAGVARVDADDASDVQRALGAVVADGGAPASLLLHLDPDPTRHADPTPHADPADDADPVGDVDAAATALARRAFHLLQQVLRSAGPQLRRIVVVSTGAYEDPARPGGPTGPEAGVLTGVVKAVVAEYPDVQVVQVDLEPGTGVPAAWQLLRWADDLPGSGHLAIRAGECLHAELERVALPEAPDGPVGVRPDGSYLVTGGLGGIGLAFAGWLADRGARTLVLLGRRPPDEDPPAVEALRARGLRVDVLAADVADAGDVARVMAHLRAELPPLRGVVHAAGITADGPMDAVEDGPLEAVLAPKVRGAWLLHWACADVELDFLLLCSSLAALVGSPGQSGYVVANCFLDRLAEYRTARGQRTLSIGWGPWAEAGMAARGGLLPALARRGVGGVGTREALDAAAGLLAGSTPPSLAVARVDWARQAPTGVPYTLVQRVAGTRPDPSPATGPGPDVEALVRLVVEDPASAHALLLDLLLDRVAPLLGFTPADTEDLRPTFGGTRLSELGLDSLMAVRLRNLLQAELSADVPPHVLFGGATVAEVVDVLCEQLTLRSVLVDADGVDDDLCEVVSL